MFSAMRELEHEAAALPVLGDVPEPGVEHLARRSACSTSLPATAIVPGSRVPQAGDRVDQLGLAVAVDAGDADDLAGAHLERDAAHLLDAAVVEHVQVLDLEQRLARVRRRLLDAEQHLAADHQLRASESSVAPARGTVSIFLPRRSTVIRSAISSTSFSLWLMKMIDFPSAWRLLDDREQLARLLRRQHRGRLVEDQDLGAAVERLQDLDALLLADRDLARSARPGRRRARTASRARGRARSAAALVEDDAVAASARCASTMFSATVITGISMKCWCTIPIPALDRVLRRVERDGLRRRRRISPSSGL